jgi:hypothetical protein
MISIKEMGRGKRRSIEEESLFIWVNKYRSNRHIKKKVRKEVLEYIENWTPFL